MGGATSACATATAGAPARARRPTNEAIERALGMTAPPGAKSSLPTPRARASGRRPALRHRICVRDEKENRRQETGNWQPAMLDGPGKRFPARELSAPAPDGPPIADHCQLPVAGLL